MSAKYFVFAGGRWCEVDTRSGHVSGWRARARFCFIRGQRLHAARSAAVLRALRALAVGVPAAVRDAAPLPHCPRPRHPGRSRSRRRSSCRPLAHAHCCGQNHSRCDANEFKSKPPPAPTVFSPRNQRRASIEQEIRVLESASDYAIKKNQASPQKSQQELRHKRQSSSEEIEDKPTRKPVTRTRQSSQQHVNVVVLDKNAACSSSSDESDNPTRGKTSPRKAQKLRHKRQSSGVEEIEEKQHKRATRAQKSFQNRNVVVLDETTSATSDEEPQISKITGKTPKYPAAKSQKQSRYRRVMEVASTDEDSDDKPATPKTRSQPQRQNSRHADVIIADDNKPMKTSKSIPPKVVTVSDSSSKEIKTKYHPKVVTVSDSSSEESKTKYHKVRKVGKAEKLLKHLLETSEDEATGEESERVETEKEPPARFKELVIGESDVETLRRFVKERGGRDKLKRFDRDERYKLRLFHRFNPLVSLERCQPLENLLRQQLTLKEFAENLGLRSVAEVTPEKRYRMRRSTKNARNVTSDTEERETVAKPKRRRLWNNDNAMFNRVSESISSEMLKAKQQIMKPAVNRDSPADFSDSDAEFKRKVREQLAKIPRTDILEGTLKAHTKPTGTFTPFKENVKPNNSSSAKVAEMLKSSEDEPIQTRSNKNTPTVKAQGEVVRENNQLKSAKVNRANDEIRDVRQTRSSLKGENPIKPKLSNPVSESISVVKSKAITKIRESSERVVRNTRSSNVAEIPARTLKEQNKKVSSDSESAFESSKSLPKKANLIRKGKMSSNAQPPNKKGKDDGTEAIDEESARAKENKKKSAFVNSMTVKPVKFKKSCVANGREYTSLEDHAIVAWVCGGDLRERRVNGNRLWRELALDYRQLTGQDRSWHSLRNRYLRYVLPALGALALPPAQVSRLRAAASAGEIKSRGAKQRRNSIFVAPAVRSASSALRNRAGKEGGKDQSEREQRSKTDAKEQKESEVHKEQSKQKSGTRAREVGRGTTHTPKPKKEPPSPAPRVTRSSVGSPSKGHRHK